MTVMLIELGLTGVVMFQFGAYYQWSFFFSFATRMFYNSVFFFSFVTISNAFNLA